MPHRLLRLVVMAVAFLSSVDCHWWCPDTCNPGQTTVTVTEQDAGTTVELCLGDSLKIALQGDLSSAGFGWYLQSFDTAMIEQVGEKDVACDVSPPLAGGECTETVEFKAIGLGQTTVRMMYQRIWETDVPPLQTFEITVVVRER